MMKDVDRTGGEGSGAQKEDASEVRKKRQVQALSEAEVRRRERTAEKLRENLLKRKQQQRARRAGDADETDGLPAAIKTNRDD
ncbi:hypothetical protein [Peteryoungia desertarenae]